MLQNEYLIAKIGVDTAENEPIGKSDQQSDLRIEPERKLRHVPESAHDDFGDTSTTSPLYSVMP